MYARSEVVLLDDPLAAVDSGTTAHFFKHCLDGEVLSGRTVILVTSYVDLCTQARTASHLIELEDGRIAHQCPTDKARRPQGHNRAESDLGSIFKSGKGDSDGFGGNEKPRDNGTDTDEDSGSEESISWSVYVKYLLSMGGLLFWIPYLIVNIVAHLLMLAQNGWVGKWVNAPDRDEKWSYYFGIYAAIQIAGGVFLTVMYLYLIFGAVRASGRIYEYLTDRVLGAPVRWFDRTPLGRIINRYAKKPFVSNCLS